MCQPGGEVGSLWSSSSRTSCWLRSGSTSSRMAIDNFITRLGGFKAEKRIILSRSCLSTMVRRRRAAVPCQSGSRAGAGRRLAGARSSSVYISHPLSSIFLLFLASTLILSFLSHYFFVSCTLPFSHFLSLISRILWRTWTSLSQMKMLHFQTEVSSQVIYDFESLLEFFLPIVVTW